LTRFTGFLRSSFPAGGLGMGSASIGLVSAAGPFGLDIKWNSVEAGRSLNAEAAATSRGVAAF
jgi:hypothetical protein